MHVRDIKRDLANGELKGAERAFRALIANEKPIAGATNLHVLTELLDALCALLLYDDRAMPRALTEAIGHAMGRDPDDCTYAGGARSVRAHLAHWRGLLAERYPAAREADASPAAGSTRALDTRPLG